MGDTLEVTVTPDTKIDPSTVTTPSTPAVPDKFKGKSLEEVIASYTELEKKIGQKPTETPAPKIEVTPTPEVPATVPSADLSKYEAEFVQNGKLSDATYAELQKNHNLPKDQVDSIIAGRQAQATVRANEIFSAVGGEETYTKMVQWAATNMSTQEQQAYNAAVNGGDVNAMRLAVDALEARYTKAYGNEPNLVKSGHAASTTNGFKSLAEMTAAMSDPRYSGPINKRDPAYIAQVEARAAAM